MEATVIAAIIAAAASVVICIINNAFTQRGIIAKHDSQMQELIAHNEESIALIQQSVDNLKNEVEKHNNIVERVYALEGKAETFKTMTVTTQKDITELKGTMNRVLDKL